MDFWDKFKVRPVKDQPSFVLNESRTTAEKVAFHIRRFTLAIEQCEKGHERRDELQSNLDYWLSVRDLEAMRGGLK